ncbi:MAG: VWA domain-containing protein [Vicinamibacterales bacterium]
MRATVARALVLVGMVVLSVQTPRADQQQTPQTPPAQPAAPPSAQPPAARPPATQQEAQRQPTFRTGINFVRVDVIVSDSKGNPVMDLTPEEFTVAEDGKPQKVETFTVVKIDPLEQYEAPNNGEIRTANDEEREAARPEVRLFVIFLDDYHVKRGNDMAVKRPLIEFIQNQLAPLDMVAIMYPLTPVNDISFTRSRARLVSAIENFEGRKFNYQPRNQFEEQYAYYPSATVERIRNQVSMSAIKAAAIRLGGLREGRKSIIYVSEGFTTALPPQLQDPNAQNPGMNNPNRRNPNAQNDDRYNMQTQADMFSDMRDVFDAVNRQNTSIYAVDPRGLAPFEYDINQGIGLTADANDLRASIDTLHVLANSTDGRAIVNRNDLAAGMKQIMRDSSAYYLLGYTSSRAPTDGKFHEIKVNVKRRGVDVRARKGYWALSKDDVARATAPPKPEAPPAVSKALMSLAEPSGGRPARFWIGTTRGENGLSRVTFTWEPIEIPANDTRTEPAARIALTAVSHEGRPLFRGRIPEEGTPPAAPAAAATAAGSAAHGGSVTFEVPPGQLQMRITVEGQKGQVVDSVTRELTVPDYTRVQVTLGTPKLFRARTVRDLQAIRASASAVPVVDREFSRSERLLVRVDAFAPGGLVPEVTAKLMNRSGAAMSDLALQPGVGGSFEAELPLSALAAGDYLIEFTAKAPSGTTQDTIAFRVGR